MTRRHRYSRRTLAADYLRGFGGLVLTAAPPLLMHPAPAVSLVLAVGAALFLVYSLRVAVRQLTSIEVDAAGIRSHGPRGAAIRWGELRSVRLNYYSTRRDHAGGWMQLDLKGAHGSIRIDSSLEGFAEVVREAARAAQAAGCDLDERTCAHLSLLGANAGASDPREGARG